jgi:hypothetical protein
MTVQDVTGDSKLPLDQNRQRLLKEVRVSLSTYEARYELASDQLEGELAAGRIRETAEICDWVIALHSYRLLERERPSA